MYSCAVVFISEYRYITITQKWVRVKRGLFWPRRAALPLKNELVRFLCYCGSVFILFLWFALGHVIGWYLKPLLCHKLPVLFWIWGCWPIDAVTSEPHGHFGNSCTPVTSFHDFQPFRVILLRYQPQLFPSKCVPNTLLSGKSFPSYI